jgi:hypothetical protein
MHSIKGSNCNNGFFGRLKRIDRMKNLQEGCFWLDKIKLSIGYLLKRLLTLVEISKMQPNSTIIKEIRKKQQKNLLNINFYHV